LLYDEIKEGKGRLSVNSLIQEFRSVVVAQASSLILLIILCSLSNPVIAETSGEKEKIALLISKVVKAYGGEQNITNIRTIYARGKINAIAFREKGVYVYYFKRPGRLRVKIRYTRSSELRILDDGKGYESLSGAPITEIGGIRYLAMVYQYKQIDLPYGLSGDTYEIRYEGKTTLKGMRAEVLSLDDREGPPMKIYIDTKKFFIRKVSGYFSVDNSNTALSVEFADFRKIGGTVLPYKITNFADAQEIAETVIQEYRLNGKMGDSLFTPP
jgi:hypothetical protein